jgi:hypothetical protein
MLLLAWIWIDADNRICKMHLFPNALWPTPTWLLQYPPVSRIWLPTSALSGSSKSASVQPERYWEKEARIKRTAAARVVSRKQTSDHLARCVQATHRTASYTRHDSRRVGLDLESAKRERDAFKDPPLFLAAKMQIEGIKWGLLRTSSDSDGEEGPRLDRARPIRFRYLQLHLLRLSRQPIQHSRVKHRPWVLCAIRYDCFVETLHSLQERRGILEAVVGGKFLR